MRCTSSIWCVAIASKRLFWLLMLSLNSFLALAPAAAAPLLSYEITAHYPHDPRAFTQGLLWHDERLYESTGLYGRSSLRRVNPENGVVELKVNLAPQLFGEGLALVEDRLVQLTWRARTGIVYERDSFRVIHRFGYQGQGWGLTFDGRQLIMSDGTDSLRFLDVHDFRERSRVRVRDGSMTIANLNELEFASSEKILQLLSGLWGSSPRRRAGRPQRLDRSESMASASSQGVYYQPVMSNLQGNSSEPEASSMRVASKALGSVVFANVWQTDQVLLIDPHSGSVLARLDFAGLLSDEERKNADVLNGLAYDSATDSLWVTGKLWPKIFQIRLRHP